jgi:hypothetical protein
VPVAPPASFDWHALILVPFGTALKDVPLALTEVLLFQDAAHAAGASAQKDCYTVDGVSPPQFLGQRPDDYLLCFEHDRLHRIEASVQLPALRAGQIFAAACRDWQLRAKAVAGAAAADAAVDDAAETCAGSDDVAEFSAALRTGAPPAEGMHPAEGTHPAEVARADDGAAPTATVEISLIGADP